MEQDQHQAETVLPSAALAALHRGNKIEAIKLVRAERGIGLKESKEMVEGFLRTQPSVRARFAAMQAQSRRKALWWLAVVVAAGVLLYAFATKQ